jgi:hypothetical protein
MDSTGILALFAGATEGLFYNSGTSETPVWTKLYDLQDVPQLGAAPELVEVTTLQNTSRRYINGIKDYGELAFTFLYDNASATSSYRVLRGLEIEGEAVSFKLVLPDTTEFAFGGAVSTAMNAIAINAPLTFTMNLALNSDIEVTSPDESSI